MGVICTPRPRSCKGIRTWADLRIVNVGAEPPETRYVDVGGVDVAYQVFGEGVPDYLYCYGLGSSVDLAWDLPGVAAYFRHLASFCRPIFFDRRGTGASGGLLGNAVPTWEEWAEDIGAVLDAVGSTQAVLGADLDAGPFAILYAALHPERIQALVLSNTAARYIRADDYPMGVEPEAVEALVELVATSWGTPQLATLTNPSLSSEDPIAQRTAWVARALATPRAAAAQYDYILRNLDVRQALPLVKAPTLVLHTSGNLVVPRELSRYLADHIEGASFLELQGTDVGSLSVPPMEELEAIAEFITGERPRIEIESVLTTALFTDIVDSTRTAADLGDRRWRSLLDSHDDLVRHQLRRFRGQEIKATGDGFLASFDGPARAIRCAVEIVKATLGLGLEIRAGLHTGECQVRGNDLSGLAIHIASRVGSMATAGEVLVSGTVKDLVIGSGIEFVERGERELKGVPGSWKLFAVQV
jgi:class 3 adenylate cyclase